MDNQLLLAALTSSQLLIQNFFKNRSDPTQPFTPFPAQCQLYNIVDFGYDLKNKYDPKHYPEIVAMLFPRQYGKTEGVATLAAALAVRFPGCQIGIMSNTTDNAEKLIGRIAWFLEHSVFVDLLKRRRADRILLDNGSAIYSFGQTENVRGNDLWWLIIDEAAQMDDDLIEGAAFPTVRTAGAFKKYGTPSIIMLSTPREAKGTFIEYYLKGISQRKIVCSSCGAFYTRADFPGVKEWDHPRNLPPLPPCPHCAAPSANYEWVYGDYGIVTIDPYSHPMHTREQIDAELARRGNTPLARRELLGELQNGANTVFTRQLVESATDQDLHNVYDPNIGTNYVMSVDFGKMHDATVFMIGHRKDEKNCLLDYVEYMPAEGGLEYADIRYRLLSLVSAYNPSLLVMDANGIGDPIVEQIHFDLIELQHHSITCVYKATTLSIRINQDLHTQIYCNKGNRRGFVTDVKTKIDLIDNMLNFFQRSILRIPSQVEPDMKVVYEELINYGYEYTNSDYIKYGTQHGHDDTVMALAMLCWGLHERPWFSVLASTSGEDQYVL